MADVKPESAGGAAIPRRKKRNRWGDAEEAAPSPSPAAPASDPVPDTVPAGSAGDAAVSLVKAEAGVGAVPAPHGKVEEGNGDGAAPDAPKRARKSRWGAPEAMVPSGDASGRRSRWGARDAAAPAAAPGSTLSVEKMQEMVLLQMRLKQLTDELRNVATEAARIEALPPDDPTRPPSPAPVYDAHGKRTNSRELRMRRALVEERQKILTQLTGLNPGLQRGPGGPSARHEAVRISRKVYIPIEDFPNYNFIGLIIGPRGNTQKAMERETRCKIAIRGKGSVKEGSRHRSSGSSSEDLNDKLHVLITGDNETSVENAAKMVTELMVPIDDDLNEHKQRQLRELALMNGTLREDEHCHICGERGHRQYECPKRAQQFKAQAAGVRCAVCGDRSHPTRDCPFRNKDNAGASKLEEEFQSFMGELDGKPPQTGGVPGRPGGPAPGAGPGPGGDPAASRQPGGFAGGRGPPPRGGSYYGGGPGGAGPRPPPAGAAGPGGGGYGPPGPRGSRGNGQGPPPPNGGAGNGWGNYGARPAQPPPHGYPGQAPGYGAPHPYGQPAPGYGAGYPQYPGYGAPAPMPGYGAMPAYPGYAPAPGAYPGYGYPAAPAPANPPLPTGEAPPLPPLPSEPAPPPPSEPAPPPPPEA